MTIDVVHIAEICHAANKALCDALGDNSQSHWYQAPAWQRESAIAGVRFALSNPEATPQAQHEAWLASKTADGWIWGAVKDPRAKAHPCIVPYDQLPPEQKVKDQIFLGIVRAVQAAGLA